MQDLINRQDAIDACLDGWCACVKDCVDEIKKLPSVQKTERWIPCSERLPEVDKGVFVYIYDMPFIAWVDKNGEWNTETFTLDKELERDDEPIAWMPLPHQLI